MTAPNQDVALSTAVASWWTEVTQGSHRHQCDTHQSQLSKGLAILYTGRSKESEERRSVTTAMWTDCWWQPLPHLCSHPPLRYGFSHNLSAVVSTATYTLGAPVILLSLVRLQYLYSEDMVLGLPFCGTTGSAAPSSTGGLHTQSQAC